MIKQEIEHQRQIYPGVTYSLEQLARCSLTTQLQV